MYKRNEPFRFQFEPPILGQFEITKIEGRIIQSSIGTIHVVDISQGGIKCKIPFDINVHKEVILNISFSLNEDLLKYSGVLVWQKKEANQYLYGIKLDTDDQLSKQLHEELKKYIHRKSPISNQA